MNFEWLQIGKHLSSKFEIWNFHWNFDFYTKFPITKKVFQNSIDLWLLQIQFDQTRAPSSCAPPVKINSSIIEKNELISMWKLSSILNENIEWHCMQMAEGYMQYMKDASAQV